MTRYGFVIDHRRCIGCHACTVACKMENDVPLGAFRTWVKYVEKGEFPNARRYFTVLRCQHCEDAPCVKICPTSALYKRQDGIVDFNNARCIGCKSCLQACPYDALYVDPRSHTAAKCHYCAHRTSRGFLPACVIVCPEKAIVAGDLEDPTSEIARLVAREQVQIRRPEQGTRPQVFYIGADEAAITPGLAVQPPMYLWAAVGPAGVDLEPKGETTDAQPSDSSSPAPGRPRTVYDVPHPKPWGWKVGAYLWTKSAAAGVLGLAGLLIGAGLAPASRVFALVPSLVALLFIALTGWLLISDLERPDRFAYVLTKANRNSWLVWGAWSILLFGAVAGLWLLAGLAGLPSVVRVLAWPALVLAVATAGYSAFLFGQAEGRDFWQSPILLWHLLAGAAVAGSATLTIVSFALGSPSTILTTALVVAIAATTALTLADLYSLHPNKDAARAARLITHGRWRGSFWGFVGGGGLISMLLAAIALAGIPVAAVPAAILALAGLWIYEDLWVKAGQSVAIS